MSTTKTDKILPLYVFCDFCGRGTDVVGTLVRGMFGVHICEQCASDVMDAFEEHRLKQMEDEL